MNEEDQVINPLTSWQLGHTEEGYNIVVVSLIGENGKTVYPIFPDPSYLEEVATMLAQAAMFLRQADEEGYDSVAERINLLEDDTPDDISSLMEGD